MTLSVRGPCQRLGYVRLHETGYYMLATAGSWAVAAGSGAVAASSWVVAAGKWVLAAGSCPVAAAAGLGWAGLPSPT